MSDQWPPRWDLPPEPPATGAAATPVSPAPWSEPDPGTAADRTNAWDTASPNGAPHYQLPPDLVPSTGLPAAPTVITQGHTPPLPAPSRAPAPLLVVGAVAAAVVIGVVATLLAVRPWERSTGTGGSATGVQTAQPTYAASPTTADSVAPTWGDPGAALRAQAVADRSSIALVPDGYWVPQLSSKRAGLVADGQVYTETSIWADHTAIRSHYPGAALLWSGDYTTFKYQDFWVTVMPSASSSTPEGANIWCENYGFDADHCYAKRISTTTVYSTTTKNR